MTRTGINQRKLAEAVGVTPAAMSRYVEGRVPRADELLRIARYFAVSMEQLLTGSGTIEPMIVRETGAGYSAKSDDGKWRDRAIAAEHKVEVLKSGLEGLLKKI